MTILDEIKSSPRKVFQIITEKDNSLTIKITNQDVLNFINELKIDKYIKEKTISREYILNNRKLHVDLIFSMSGNNIINIKCIFYPPDNEEQCNACHGDGEHWCEECDDYHTCNKCDGTGTIFYDDINDSVDPVEIFNKSYNLNQLIIEY